MIDTPGPTPPGKDPARRFPGSTFLREASGRHAGGPSSFAAEKGG